MNENHVIPNINLNLFRKPALLNKGLRNPDPARVSDWYQRGFHDDNVPTLLLHFNRFIAPTAGSRLNEPAGRTPPGCRCPESFPVLPICVIRGIRGYIPCSIHPNVAGVGRREATCRQPTGWVSYCLVKHRKTVKRSLAVKHATPPTNTGALKLQAVEADTGNSMGEYVPLGKTRAVPER